MKEKGQVILCFSDQAHHIKSVVYVKKFLKKLMTQVDPRALAAASSQEQKVQSQALGFVWMETNEE